MKIVLLGAPGSGKGTQASLVSKEYDLLHISTGEIFRDNIQKKTPLGLKINELISAGNLCPDDLTIEIVKDRLAKPDCEKGYLLDGFPRNIVQAEALNDFAKPDVVINIHLDLEIVENRITGRRSCSKCNNIYHISKIGDTDVCPDCGGKLIIRKDDNVDSVKTRLKAYKDQTEPLIEYYEKQNILVTVDGSQAIDQVFENIKKVLG